MKYRTISNRDLLASAWTWCGNSGPAIGDETSPVDISTRLDAVQIAGWKGVGFVHADLMKIARTVGLDNLRLMLDDRGIERVELEFLSNWWADGELRAASDAVRRDLFAAAPSLGVDTIKVGAQLQAFGAGDAPLSRQRFAESFAALADDARAHGLRVAIEPMPMSNIPTIVDGANLVREVGNPSGGLVVDIWHVARGGTSYAEMTAALPIEHVFVIELDDADAEVGGTLWDDTVNNRRIPGDGVLNTAAFIAAMHDVGWRGYWGVEIISKELRCLPVTEAVHRVQAGTMSAIHKAEMVSF